MTYSTIGVPDLLAYLRIEQEDLDELETGLLQSFIDSAKAYTQDYTGQTVEYLDAHNDIPIAVLCLAGEMYSRRNMVTNIKGTGTATVNRTVQTILDMHSRNLVPEVNDV